MPLSFMHVLKGKGKYIVMYPTKYVCILMLAPFRQKWTVNLHWILYKGNIFVCNNCGYGTKFALKFNADLEPISKIAAEIASSNGTIWDEFSEQH